MFEEASIDSEIQTWVRVSQICELDAIGVYGYD